MSLHRNEATRNTARSGLSLAPRSATGFPIASVIKSSEFPEDVNMLAFYSFPTNYIRYFNQRHCGFRPVSLSILMFVFQARLSSVVHQAAADASRGFYSRRQLGSVG